MDTGDVGAVLEEVRRSTVAQAEEIIELRRSVRDRDGMRLLACAGLVWDVRTPPRSKLLA